MNPIRILLVDDSFEFIEALVRFLSADAAVEVVGYRLSGSEVIEQLNELKPDLVLMDLAMPGINGLEATRLVKQQPDAPRVILLTLYDNSEYREAASQAHADGYVVKSDLGGNLLPLIHTLVNQEQTQ
jgi:DNA-binding NarL/FixJ family response regulator